MSIPGWAAQMDQWAESKIPFLFILDFDLGQPILLTLDEIPASGIRYEINRFQSGEPVAEAIEFSRTPPDFSTYKLGFQKVQLAIHAGDTYLLNLTYATKLGNIPSLETVFDSVRAPYKLLVPGKFVLFSPEQFVHIGDGLIKTFPMKGTIDASLPNAEASLLEDRKEQEEHATVVDLLRNDLSIVARKVSVERYRFITEIIANGSSLLQCSSAISGVLKEEYNNRPGSIFYNILPAGSVTGAPKKKTVELIKEIEPEPRGYYTGVFGVFDGRQIESAVMIRMIEQRANGFYYRSGGGITYRSEAKQEYQEVLDKIYLPL